MASLGQKFLRAFQRERARNWLPSLGGDRQLSIVYGPSSPWGKREAIRLRLAKAQKLEKVFMLMINNTPQVPCCAGDPPKTLEQCWKLWIKITHTHTNRRRVTSTPPWVHRNPVRVVSGSYLSVLALNSCVLSS